MDSGLLLKGAGWLEAGQLRRGDRLRTASGQDATVVGIRWDVGRAPVYTLTVTKDHTFFVGAARVLVHNADGACPILFHNTLPERLPEELATATRLGVRPLRVGEQGFDEAINEGTVKWVVTEAGDLLIIPKYVHGTELAHTVLTGGRDVQAAGEADVVGSKGHYILLEIDNHSGHYLPSASSLEIGREAFRRAGVEVP